MECETGDDLIDLKESLSALPGPTEWSTSDLEPDEYARYNDLTVDSLLDPWLACLDNHVLATLPLVEDESIVEVEGLQECFFREVIPAREQLQMSAPSLKLIQEASKSVADPDVAGLMAELRSTLSSERKPVSKFDVPVLRTDHEFDCRQMARRISLFRNGQLADHRLPLHPVNGETGESLEFSVKAKRGDEAVMKAVARDSLEMTRETFVFLSQCLKADLAEADKRAFLDEAYTYKGVRTAVHPCITHCCSPQTTTTNRRAGTKQRAPHATPQSPTAALERVLCPRRRDLQDTRFVVRQRRRIGCRARGGRVQHLQR